MIVLELSDDEASAVRVALVGLIQEPAQGPIGERWRVAASAVAERLAED